MSILAAAGRTVTLLSLAGGRQRESEMGGFRVYIDEAGDEGFKFRDEGRDGSSHWFVLSAAITRAESDLETVKVLDEVRTQLKKPPKSPFHFRDMKHDHRLALLDAIAKRQIRTVSVLVHKPSLSDNPVYREKGHLYRYATRLLLERVSWLCRDHRHADGHVAKLVFSNRANMSYEALKGYLWHLRASAAEKDIRIEWDAIDVDDIEIYAHTKRMGLQIADAVASGIFNGVERSPNGFTEPRYAEFLRTTMYSHRGKRFTYGLKVWPHELVTRKQPPVGAEWLLDDKWHKK